MLGDWIEIFWELTCGPPLSRSEILWHVPTVPRPVEVSIDVAKINAELRLAIPWARLDLANKLAEMCMGIFKIAEKQRPAHWVGGAINHVPDA